MSPPLLLYLEEHTLERHGQTKCNHIQFPRGLADTRVATLATNHLIGSYATQSDVTAQHECAEGSICETCGILALSYTMRFEMDFFTIKQDERATERLPVILVLKTMTFFIL